MSGIEKGRCMSVTISWSMVAILRDSVVVAVLRTRPRALAVITLRKSNSWISFAFLYGYGATSFPGLEKPWERGWVWGSATVL